MSDPILFIESDPAGLERLAGLLRDREAFTGAVLAEGLDDARAKLREAPFKAVVLGGEMSDADAAAFLSEVETAQPDCPRFVRRPKEGGERLVKSLGKPCVWLSTDWDGDTLESTVKNVLLLTTWRKNTLLREVTAKMSRLPSIPSLYLEVTHKLQSPDASLEDVAVHISHDLAMCAMLLRVVNSAEYGLATQIKSAFEAVMFLGVEQTKALILFSKLFSQFDSAKQSGFSLDEFWLHSVGVANIARWIAREETGKASQADEAYTAGLLHDVGKLLVAANLPKVAGQLYVVTGKGEKISVQLEQSTLGATHAGIGAYLLASWGLPNPILETIAFHHNPSVVQSSQFSPLTAVHAADLLDYEKRFGPSGQLNQELDRDYLSRMFPENPMDRWRTLVGIPVQGAVASSGGEAPMRMA